MNQPYFNMKRQFAKDDYVEILTLENLNDVKLYFQEIKEHYGFRFFDILDIKDYFIKVKWIENDSAETIRNISFPYKWEFPIITPISNYSEKIFTSHTYVKYSKNERLINLIIREFNIHNFDKKIKTGY